MMCNNHRTFIINFNVTNKRTGIGRRMIKNIGTVKINKRKIVIYTFVLIALSLLICLIRKFYLDDEENYGVTYAQTAKVIALSCATPDEKFDDMYNWYDAYVDYVNANGYMDIDNANAYITEKDLADLSEKFDYRESAYWGKTGRRKVSRQKFTTFLKGLIPYLPNAENIREEEISIAGTPDNTDNTGEWEAYTSKGKLRYTGLIIRPYIDKVIKVFSVDNEILFVEKIVDNSTTYKNIWVKNVDNGIVYTNVYGAERQFSVKKLSQDVGSCLADIKVESGKLKSVAIKDDTISGKVLSVSDDYIEIQGYGKIPIDESFMIYDNKDSLVIKKYTDIVVGYSLQDFVVAEGKICGAVISKPFNVVNIRVMITTTGFKSIFHNEIELTSDYPFTVVTQSEEKIYDAGTVIKIDGSNEDLQSGRISIRPQSGGTIRCLNIQRELGNPEYSGEMEIAAFDEGIVVINDVDIEEYLKKVIPSEMPVYFGYEALKVQAVCARSYAYSELYDAAYKEYGAHIDDSVKFQVYNNLNEDAVSNEAVNDTKGEVITNNQEIVKTYYYSTSWGQTANVEVWGSDCNDYPIYESKSVNPSQKEKDYTDETVFRESIMSEDENDYDYSSSLYRWNINLSIDELSSGFNKKLLACISSNPGKIYVIDGEENILKKIYTVGKITGIEVLKRATGGACVSIKVTGTENSVIINGEGVIRTLFGNGNVSMTTKTGERKFDSLPSAYCIFNPYYENGELGGYNITGGGFGHGIGMSQNAVKKMSETMSYKDILHFFYSGIEINVWSY